MNEQIHTFLSLNKISVVTTLLSDGSPHGAALHFSHNENPLELYFSTEKSSRKCQALGEGKSTKAAVVIGFSEKEWITLQMEGEIVFVTEQDALQKVQAVHYAKHPGSAKYKDDPETVFLKFTPTWWRYTDYNTDPYTIISSEE